MSEEVKNQNPKPESQQPHVERPKQTGATATVKKDPRRFPPKN